MTATEVDRGTIYPTQSNSTVHRRASLVTVAAQLDDAFGRCGGHEDFMLHVNCITRDETLSLGQL